MIDLDLCLIEERVKKKTKSSLQEVDATRFARFQENERDKYGK
jgi:hypothetical protein